MSLNIKNPEAEELARKLQRLTGESLTQAVIVAMSERLGRLQQGEADKAERLLAIGRDMARRMGTEYTSQNFDAMLYDEATGLPR
ncbi:type II toxin-antitoxin system VapB family antitoxin [Nonomuraea sp. NBC_01738]|uniref:type II toxin-antitoxin system VapB family antitoxin n=1 Tax=Nonomuraea sp. NBC_01738 TaxID=2976003 RepID=UPI002E10F083|nr:type II toxin-antitoxin system VapB family antitoxin [Nonomuraea sp. NBC_01738]